MQTSKHNETIKVSVSLDKVRNHFLKLCEGNLLIRILIMFWDNLIYFFFTNCISNFGESILNVAHWNTIRVVNVEFFEQSLGFCFSQLNILDSDCCSNKFRIVNLLVLIIIQFIDNFLNILRFDRLLCHWTLWYNLLELS